MNNQHFHVITGASGGGKSTLLAALKERGYSTVPEAALAVMREQLDCNGKILPAVDRTAFLEKVLFRSIQDHEVAQQLKGPVFFDRGIPEWLHFLGTSIKPATIAAAKCGYANTVFVVEPWTEIYVCDHYRQHSFEQAVKSYEPTISAYIEAGYKTCVIPKLSVEERVDFVLAQIETEPQR